MENTTSTQGQKFAIGGKPLPQRGRTFIGTVKSDRMMSTVTVEWPRRQYNAKYQRYEKRRSRVHAHNPKEINAKIGDTVRIVETRPISKTKHFLVVEVLSASAAPVATASKEAKKAPVKAAPKKAPAKKAVKASSA